MRRTELEQEGLRGDELDALLHEFGRHRLLTFDRDASSRTPTVEVAHEALLDHWSRLRTWIDDARDDLLTRRRLAAATADWLGAGSDPSFLYGGGRLDIAEAWAERAGLSLTIDEHRFLTSSRARAQREATAHTRRRRTVVGLLGAGLVATTVFGALAFTQRAAADDQAQQARARDLAGQAELAIGEDPERAVMLALTAMQTTHAPLPEAVSALQMATQADRVVTTVDDVADQAFAAATRRCAPRRRPTRRRGVLVHRRRQRHGDDDDHDEPPAGLAVPGLRPDRPGARGRLSSSRECDPTAH